MINPLISIRGAGHSKGRGFAAIRAVALHLHFGVDNKHEFVAVKTTNRLLPEYAKSIEKYSWFHRDGGVDVTDRTLTLYPKQLMGSSGTSSQLYAKFVSCDPSNTIGEKHFTLVRERIAAGERAKALKFTWNAERKTTTKVREPEPRVIPFGPRRARW